MFRRPHTKEEKEKIRKGNIGKEVNEKTKKRLSKSHLGKKHSEKTKKKMSKTHKRRGSRGPIRYGKECNFWKGGISKTYKEGYGSLKYRLWREAVFTRDNYICQKCGFKGNQGYITAHHIKGWTKYPELRFNIDNGITLCEDCHSKTDNYKGRGNRK